jgi:hypothetical protein
MSDEAKKVDNGGCAAFPCSRCGIQSVRIQGHQHLCEKHYRFGQMKASAKRHGKPVPSNMDLEEMCLSLTEMRCPTCGRTMNWMGVNGRATVATLQHDRSGLMRILCLSCNTRHASFKGDTFYINDDKTRMCPNCKKTMDRTSFCVDRSSRWLNTNTYCRSCRNEMQRRWVSNNREVYNEKRRKYYHERRLSGNPIPR